MRILESWKFNNAVSGSDKQVNATAIASIPAPGVGKYNRIVKIDASYSVASVSGLLQIKSGAVVIFEKYIHGAGALDSPEVGKRALNTNEAMSVELAAGGAGVTGTVTVSGFWHEVLT